MLKGKVGLVTGASSGIGRAIALQWAREGAKVVVSDVNTAAGEETVALVLAQGGDALFVAADVGSAADSEALVQRTLAHYGRLDLACNNAGIGGPQAPTADYPLDGWAQVININLSGVFYGMKYQIAAMLKSGGGAITNVASILGAVGFATAPAYTAAKQTIPGEPWSNRGLLFGGAMMGLVLALGINLQQVGLLFTSVTNSGFITGLYVIIVPLIGLFIGHKTGIGIWLGAILAVVGMFLLCVGDNFQVASGDWLQLAGAFVWAVHVLLVGFFASRHDPLRLALIQFATCAVISLTLALVFETATLEGIFKAGPAILYGGIFGVAIGFTAEDLIGKLTVLVASTPDFTEHHLVANGASNLIVGVLGDRGKHARAAFGVAAAIDVQHGGTGATASFFKIILD